MADLKKLSGILAKMYEAAKSDKKDEVLRLNRDEFSPLYAETFGSGGYKNPIEEDFDIARNDCLNALMTFPAGHEEKQKKYRMHLLKDAEQRIKRLNK